jgi:hypothetical protein
LKFGVFKDHRFSSPAASAVEAAPSHLPQILFRIAFTPAEVSRISLRCFSPRLSIQPL